MANSVAPQDEPLREPGATLHDIAQGLTVKQAIRYSSVSLEEIAEALADDWRIRGSHLADLAERHRMMCNGMNVAQAGFEAQIARQARWIEEATQWLRGVVDFHDCVTVTWDIDLKAARRLLAGPGGSQENTAP